MSTIKLPILSDQPTIVSGVTIKIKEEHASTTVITNILEGGKAQNKGSLNLSNYAIFNIVLTILIGFEIF